MTVQKGKDLLEGVYDYVLPKGKERKTFFEKAIDIAIECMEKQIPKKPIKNNPIINNSWSEDSMLCPICHKYVGTLFRDTYCCYCGQRLAKEGGTSD